MDWRSTGLPITLVICGCQPLRSPAYVVTAPGSGCSSTVPIHVHHTHLQSIRRSLYWRHCSHGPTNRQPCFMVGAMSDLWPLQQLPSVLLCRTLVVVAGEPGAGNSGIGADAQGSAG